MNYILRLVALSTTLLIGSCQRPALSQHQRTIDNDELVSILTELHLADAEAGANKLTDAAIAANPTTEYSRVFDKHHTTSAAFKETMAYYSDHPDELVKIYDEVIERLTAMQGAPQR